jgi:murein DD-endopeptidase MepM/ murein hydrolase activator NlpD
MARIRYRYNPKTCKYEPIFGSGRKLLKQSATFLFFSVLLAVCCFYYYSQHHESFNEILLKRKNKALKIEWSILQKRVENSTQELLSLIDKDDHNYRIILDSQPLPASMREAGTGGSEKINRADIGNFPAILSYYERLDKLKHQLDIEVQSFDELSKMLRAKIKMWASRPAIQPIDNRQLAKLHLTYGARFHPIFHVYMDHKGLDFAAAKGTPVYATGDGIVAMTYSSSSYGNVIYLNHGHDFETRYAHLSKFAVRPGQYVKRGQVIAYVGNTGHSVASHLHYEVLYHGLHANPINFFQRDLSNKEYDRLINDASKSVEPLD